MNHLGQAWTWKGSLYHGLNQTEFHQATSQYNELQNQHQPINTTTRTNKVTNKQTWKSMKKKRAYTPSTSSPVLGVSQSWPSLSSFFFNPFLPISFSSPNLSSNGLTGSSSTSMFTLLDVGNSKLSSMALLRQNELESVRTMSMRARDNTFFVVFAWGEWGCLLYMVTERERERWGVSV